jgi:hypothetical protein
MGPSRGFGHLYARTERKYVLRKEARGSEKSRRRLLENSVRPSGAGGGGRLGRGERAREGRKRR